MKLRNLLYATMVACAFASCSKDEVTPGVGPDVKGDAELTVKVRSLATKAEGDITKADEVISKLSVVVFNGTGAEAKVEVIGTATKADAATVTEVKATALTPGNKTIVVFANVELDAAGITATTKYSDLLLKTRVFGATEVDGTLSMSSQAYEVSIKAGVTNYLGYNKVTTGGNDLGVSVVKLYRNVAKISLAEISVVAPTVGTQYPDMKFDPQEVFILHAHNTTNLFNAAQWGTTNNSTDYIHGYAGDDYLKWVEILGEATPIFDPLTGSIGSAIKAYQNDLISDAIAIDNKLDCANSFYVYENTAALGEKPTLLVVRGEFSYTGVDKETVKENRYYTLAIGYTGVEKGFTLPANFTGLRGATTANGTLRNLEYRIKLSVKGPGYTTPFGPKPDPENPGEGGDTFLDVQVDVVDFGQVDQPGTIE